MNKPKLMTAKEDIKVYKVLIAHKIDNSHVKKTMLFSPYFRRYMWEMGKPHKVKMGRARQDIYGWYRVNDGFHSCGTITEMENIHDKLFYNEKGKCVIMSIPIMISQPYQVFECIIPKDSHYYVNDDGDYVSDSLIVLNEKKIIKGNS